MIEKFNSELFQWISEDMITQNYAQQYPVF